MESRSLTLKSALTVSGLGLLAWWMLFARGEKHAEARNVKMMGVPTAPKPPAPLRVASAPQAGKKDEKIAPIPSGVSLTLVRDVRALVAPQAMRMSGIESAASPVAPYMTAQAGAGAVRIFSIGEEVIVNDTDLKDGCFYAAETEEGPDGQARIVGFKRYTVGSPALLQEALDGKPFKPDFDPYTGQSFSERGQAIRDAIASHVAQSVVSGSLGEDFQNPPMSGHRYVIQGRKLPPSIERRMRAR